MECCIKCFDDKDLKHIVATKSLGVGNCKFCGSESETITSVENLQYKFEFLLSFLEESDDGPDVVTIIDDYFCIFSKKVASKKIELLEAILKLKFSDKKYKPKWSKFHSAGHWNELRDELISKNRYFPQSSLYRKITQWENSEDFSVFFKVLELLQMDLRRDITLFRARISDTALNDHDMGAPPTGLASSGRANPFGISYLYMASTVETAISEVRPFNEGVVYVSELAISDAVNKDNPLLFINLTNPRRDVSPFVFSEDEYELLIYSLSLLEQFSSDLSKPVKPHKSDLEYLPTQFICEYIKSLNYQGIIFNSSFGTGLNYVAFDTTMFTPSPPTAYKVHNTRYEHRQL
jgi:hypothetical protein